jgi:hypothetical protein
MTEEIDATYLKQREGGRVVSVAAIIAVAANADGKRDAANRLVGVTIKPPVPRTARLGARQGDETASHRSSGHGIEERRGHVRFAAALR